MFIPLKILTGGCFFHCFLERVKGWMEEEAGRRREKHQCERGTLIGCLRHIPLDLCPVPVPLTESNP